MRKFQNKTEENIEQNVVEEKGLTTKEMIKTLQLQLDIDDSCMLPDDDDNNLNWLLMMKKMDVKLDEMAKKKQFIDKTIEYIDEEIKEIPIKIVEIEVNDDVQEELELNDESFDLISLSEALEIIDDPKFNSMSIRKRGNTIKTLANSLEIELTYQEIRNLIKSEQFIVLNDGEKRKEILKYKNSFNYLFN